MNEPIVYNRKNENMAMPAYVTVDKRFRFSQGAINLIGMKVGRYLHLLQFGDNDWYLMVDEDKHGLRLGMEGSHIVAHAVKVCQLFIARAKVGAGQTSVSFYLEQTTKEYKGKTLWKINLERTFTSKRSRST
jgi:hypothetical protein